MVVDKIKCPRCHGRLYVAIQDGWEQCPKCKGLGYIKPKEK